MQIVIELSEEDFEKNKNARCDYHTLRMAIKNGIPLPKGHGRIVDIDKLIHYKCRECGNDINCSLPCYVVRRMLDAPIIIEADRK